MLTGRNYRTEFPFTANQWQELENQVLTFRYLMSGVPVPPALMSTVITTPSNFSSPSSSRLFPQQQQLPIGTGCFQVGYGSGRKFDPEPGRCKRTDGKKWRCSKEAHPDSKYCERHMHRSKGKAKKQIDAINNMSTTKAVTNSNPNTPTTSLYSPYPAISYCPVSQSSYHDKFQPRSSIFYPFLPAQSSSSNVRMSVRDDNTSPHWLGLNGELLDQPYKEEIRYSNQMKGAVEERILGSEASKEEHDEEKLGAEQEHDSQKLYHHFLGDWPSKLKTSHALGLFSTSN